MGSRKKKALSARREARAAPLKEKSARLLLVMSVTAADGFLTFSVFFFSSFLFFVTLLRDVILQPAAWRLEK